jgi:hypothetical protein
MTHQRLASSLRAAMVTMILPGLTVLFLVAACKGEERADSASSAAANQTGADIDPCQLVTRAEAEQALAAAPDAERPSEANNEYLATCRYVAPRGEGVVVLAVSVSRQNGKVGFQNARRMEEEGFKIQSMSGLGDDAFWVADPLHTLYVLEGDTYLSLGGDVQLEQATPLARQALQRLR